MQYTEEPLEDPKKLSHLAHIASCRIGLDETLDELVRVARGDFRPLCEFLQQTPGIEALVVKPALIGFGQTIQLAQMAGSLGIQVPISTCPLS